MHPPQGSTTAQGYEMQLGVHNLGHVLFTELLTPLLAETAKREPPGSARVVWVASLYAEMGSPTGGVDPKNIDYSKKDESKYFKYSASKAGVYYQGTEYARRHRSEGIVSLPVNPGNLKSDLQRHHPSIAQKIGNWMLYPPVNGAYTELFAGLSPKVTMAESGSYVIPFGRFSFIRSDIEQGSRLEAEGGTGMGKIWYDWCIEQVKTYM
ncbi:hypothetical protein NLG97_g7775 [Lecanicillium saksenae]|uniref:Uncharacterized protein n=1 Tax=Lecanicillium saksenae TaxID=468837 RepID=A0ACC1QP33_9HYPO|nr:hypothetical protein NLG97_g7775 [Lecanicillium saksenae]